MPEINPVNMNVICPECETENKPDAKRCVKPGCNFPLAAQSDHDRLLKAAIKKHKKTPVKTTEKEPEENDGFFDSLA